MSVLTTFIVKKIQTWTEPESGKDEPKPNRKRVTDILVNHGSPNKIYCHPAWIIVLYLHELLMIWNSFKILNLKLRMQKHIFIDSCFATESESIVGVQIWIIKRMDRKLDEHENLVEIDELPPPPSLPPKILKL